MLVTAERLRLNLGYSCTDTELITCELAGIMQIKQVTNQNKAADDNKEYGGLNCPSKLSKTTAALLLPDVLANAVSS